MTSLFDYMQQMYPNGMQDVAQQSMFTPMNQGGDAGGSGTGKLHNILKLATTGYLHDLVGGGGENVQHQTISNVDDPNMMHLMMPYPIV